MTGNTKIDFVGKRKTAAFISLGVLILGLIFIFAQNGLNYNIEFNGGYLMPLESPERLVGTIATGDEVEVDTDAGVLKHLPSGGEFRLNPLGDVGEIVAAGGVFNYARQSGMLE